jgi:hypothetical protein
MDKYLRVMADYMSTGLWNKDGANVETAGLGLSEGALKALDDWCLEYMKNDDYLPEELRSDPRFDLRGFSARGLEVAKLIKSELKDYKIVYFDEFKMVTMLDARSCDRADYEHEV